MAEDHDFQNVREHDCALPSPADDPPEISELGDLVRRLRFSFPELDVHRLHSIVREAFDHFRNARLRAFVPTLTEKRARQACRDLRHARETGDIIDAPTSS